MQYKNGAYHLATSHAVYTNAIYLKQSFNHWLYSAMRILTISPNLVFAYCDCICTCATYWRWRKPDGGFIGVIIEHLVCDCAEWGKAGA